ncbi:cellulase family glycosylhydrolase [Myxococcota bacterium]|nr:cellulase family glycosylhydrolase [Myxococcota bacterium]MBU1430560.1 cellulase family glycosylhydrolase [Myxococcota bacterium]MBU1900700.1 cellulase family glycosylhydrolase [Myxococcota bacterium]
MRLIVGSMLLAWALGAPAVAQEAVGINAHLPTEDHLDALADLGVAWVRVDANWFSMEPSQGRYDWGEMDRIVDGAQARGLEVFMTLAYTPAWASEGNDDEHPHNDVPRAGLYEAFVRAAVEHYQGRVRHFGIWNEPNLEQFWAGSRALYIERILRPGSAAVRAACGDCLVLGPDVASVSGWQGYLEAVTREAGDALDIVAHHTYAKPPSVRGGQWLCDDLRHALDIGDDLLCFYKPGLRQVLDNAGWHGPVWLTETGYRTTPWDSADEQEKQRMMVEEVLRLQRDYDWWTHTFFYELADCGPTQPGCPIDGYGLMRRVSGPDDSWEDNFLLKPAYLWLKATLAGPEWGGMAPPPDPDDSPPVEVERPTLTAPIRSVGVPDGDLDDWDDAGCAALGRWEAIDGAPRPGLGDLTARVCAAWSPQALWLAVEVEDDTHENDLEAALLWQGDSVQLALDVDADGGDDGYDEDDSEWTLALSRGQSVARTEHGAREAEVVVKREGARTRYELRVPMAGLLQADLELRASFLVNEADGAGREGWLEWTPGIGWAKQPGQFGIIRLAGWAAAPPDASLPPPVMDAGAAREDTGAAPEDAGAAPEDAGAAPEDAGAKVDGAGSQADGAGATPPQRAPDADQPQADAGADEPRGGAAGDDGCAVGGGGRAPWLLCLGLLFLCRRRACSRRP